MAMIFGFLLLTVLITVTKTAILSLFLSDSFSVLNQSFWRLIYFGNIYKRKISFWVSREQLKKHRI